MRASRISMRRSRACASERCGSGPRALSRTSPGSVTTSRATRSMPGCSFPAAGCCARRPPGSTFAATANSSPTAVGSGARSSIRPATRRHSTPSARLWQCAECRFSRHIDGKGDSVDPMTENEIPKGSYAAGRRVRLPAGAQPPFAVYVNGVEQSEGSDYEVRGKEVLFTREIVKEKVGTGRWLAMYLGLFGTYRKDETIDVQFERNGRTDLVSDLPVVKG